MLTVLTADRTGRDLMALTIAKVAIIVLIYVVLFARYDGQPVDTRSHLLGPIRAATTN